MALAVLGQPPELAVRSHVDYRDWLLRCFFDRVCAYCGIPFRRVEIDHVEPVEYAPHRRLDPTNLLPSCGDCNGRSGKSDYHPLHGRRTRHPAPPEFDVLDPRRDDYAVLFEVADDGTIDARPGST